MASVSRFALAAMVAAVGLSSGCAGKPGDPCVRQVDCDPGLVCGTAGRCQTCGEGVNCLGIDLVVRTCDPAAPSVFAPPVTRLRVSIEGDNMAPVVQTARIDAPGLRLPELPFGTNRRVVVEAYGDGDEIPLARGRSPFFDVDPVEPTPPVAVLLRRTGRFSQANGIFDPTTCSTLAVARAGHTATLLSDGRVLLAGGYGFDSKGERIYLGALERFDPLTGEFERLPDALVTPRAGHTAHVLPDGRVLFVGGYRQSGAALEPLDTAELFEPSTGRVSSVAMKSARMDHASVLLSNGVVVVSGGVAKEGARPLDSMEIFWPSAPPGLEFTLAADVKLKQPRAGHAATVVGRDRILIVGGTGDAAGTQALKSVEGFVWFGNVLRAEEGDAFALNDGRARPSALPLQTPDREGVLVVGAPARGVQTLPDAWDWLALDGGEEPARGGTPVPAYRFGACAVPFPGGALVAGGVRQSGAPPGMSTDYLDTADVYRATPAGGLEVGPAVNTLAQKRKNLACTPLADGAVLLTGGETFEQGTRRVTGMAEVFEP